MRLNSSRELNIESLLKKAALSHWYDKISANLNYKKVNDYIEPEVLSRQLATHLWIAENSPNQFGKADAITVKVICALSELANTKFLPTYWLSNNLGQALSLTELPAHWIDLKPFVKSGMIFLPKLFCNPDGHPLQWLYFSYYSVGYVFPNLEIGQVEIEALDSPLEAPILRWVTGFKDLSTYTSTIVLKKDSEGNPIRGDYHIDPTISFWGKNTEVVSEQEFSKRVDNLLFQLLLYMMEKPDSISIDRSGLGFGASSKKSQTKLQSKSLLPPSWIGKNYRLKSQKFQSDSSEERNSPRTHWRRGHWRKQPFKSRENPEYKNIWIEPMIIAG